jgi:hypothetical protein
MSGEAVFIVSVGSADDPTGCAALVQASGRGAIEASHSPEAEKSGCCAIDPASVGRFAGAAAGNWPVCGAQSPDMADADIPSSGILKPMFPTTEKSKEGTARPDTGTAKNRAGEATGDGAGVISHLQNMPLV